MFWLDEERGFYFTARRADASVCAKYIRAMRETIHVYGGTGADVGQTTC